MTRTRSITRGADLAARWTDIRDVVDLVHIRAYLLTPTAFREGRDVGSGDLSKLAEVFS